MRQRLAVMWLVLGCVGAFVSTATAQTRKSLVEQRLDALEARVAALEQSEHLRHPPPPPPPATPSPATPMPPPVAPARPAPPAPPAARANWDALHRGMSRHQVVDLLGPPDTRQVRPMTEAWFYPDGRSVQFDRNGALDSWTGP